MERGYVRLYRKITESAIMQDAECLRFWIWCLCRVTYKDRKAIVRNGVVALEPGQFICGRKAAATALKTTEQRVRTAINTLEKLGQIDVKSTKTHTVITIRNWSIYQDSDEGNQPTANQQPTKCQPTANHEQEGKKEIRKAEKKHPCPTSSNGTEIDSIIFALNEKAGTAYRLDGKKTRELIKARLNEGHQLAAFIQVIEKKVAAWGHDSKMCKYLRPETLFGTKFESYLNEIMPGTQGVRDIDPTKPMKPGDAVTILKAMAAREARENGYIENRHGEPGVAEIEFTLPGDGADS